MQKVEKGEYEKPEEAINILLFLENTRRYFQAIAASFRADLDLDLGGFIPEKDELFVAGDEELLFSAFSNLLLNAIEVSCPGDRIVVSLHTTEPRVWIRIFNPKAIPAHIRSRFGQKYITAGKADGTGLGVYSARSIVEAMDGTFSWESGREGTTVELSLC
ncbi:MAG TPA: ATP-binding protein, partial [Sediminispirochaeta sp.]|nr:ATP-binding protein [Sediminispirochaeta sp.]